MNPRHTILHLARIRDAIDKAMTALIQLDETTPMQPLSSLTPREVEFLSLIRRGLTIKDMAREKGLSIGTVKIHVRNILGKYGAASRIHLLVLLRMNQNVRDARSPIDNA